MEEHRIICLEGELQGAEILIHPGEQVIVGREPRFANLVFRDMTISRKHCVIELDELGEYYITDYSECGIVTEVGAGFDNAVRTQCERGSVLLIGKAGTKIKLK